MAKVWSKSDAVAELVKEVAPHVMAGYIVIGETEADIAKGLHAPLRLPEPEVRMCLRNSHTSFHSRCFKPQTGLSNRCGQLCRSTVSRSLQLPSHSSSPQVSGADIGLGASPPPLCLPTCSSSIFYWFSLLFPLRFFLHFFLAPRRLYIYVFTYI